MSKLSPERREQMLASIRGCGRIGMVPLPAGVSPDELPEWEKLCEEVWGEYVPCHKCRAHFIPVGSGASCPHCKTPVGIDASEPGWPVNCTPRFVELLGGGDCQTAEKAARQFLDWALPDLRKYATEGGALSGQLSYVYPPKTRPSQSDVIVCFDYDQEIVIVGIDEDGYEV